MSGTLRTAIAAAVLALLASTTVSAHDGRWRDSEGRWIHQHKTYYLAYNSIEQDELRAKVYAAGNDWSDATAVTILWTSFPGEADIFLDDDGSQVSDGAVGSTYMRYHDDSANIYFKVGKLDGGRERRHVACHEFGHALGLEHGPNLDDCMTTDYVGKYTHVGSHSVTWVNYLAPLSNHSSSCKPDCI